MFLIQNSEFASSVHNLGFEWVSILLHGDGIFSFIDNKAIATKPRIIESNYGLCYIRNLNILVFRKP
jgi:hypothetical protein